MRAYKVEIKVTQEQVSQVNRTIGVCRYLYNLYLATNQEQHKQGLSFLSANDFDKWVNNVYSTEHSWIKEVSSKSRKKAIVNAETAYKRFFKGMSKFPRFKKKRNQDVKMYAPKNNKGDWTVERHRIKVPTIGWVQLKEYGYIPVDAVVTGGTVSRKADRYYVSVTVKEESQPHQEIETDGVGVDLGLKQLAVVSDGTSYANINKTSKVKRIEKRLNREQRKLSRKYEAKKKIKKQKEGTATAQRSANIEKQIIKVQKLHQRLTHIRTNHINQVVNELVKTKPAFITIEDLNVSGMMKNRHLAKAIAQQKFYEFQTKLQHKCRAYGIEIRKVNRFYASSKLCSGCGHKKIDLKLKDRTYNCENCKVSIDRDRNASINLANAKEYKIV